MSRAICHNDLGEVARFRGDLEGAERAYRQALSLFEAIGAGDAAIARLNVLLLRLQRGQHEPVRAPLEVLAQELAEEDRHGLLSITRAALMASAAGAGDWPAFDRYRAAVEQVAREAGLALPNIATLSEQAGGLARAAGESRRARSAWTLAGDQWGRPGQTTRQAQVLEKR